MTVGEWLMNESTARLRHLRRGFPASRRWFPRLLYWGAWLNYLVSVVVLAAGLTAGWCFAETGLDLMMNNVSGHELEQRIIQKIPAWIFVYKGIRR